MKFNKLSKDMKNQTMETTEIAKRNGVELTEDTLDQISGGRPHWRPHYVPRTKK